MTDPSDTTERALRLTVVIGSVRAPRFGPTPARWIAALAGAREGLEVDVIDLAEVWLPDVHPDRTGAPPPPAVRDLAPWLAGADAFVVVTPEHNGSIPAPLKNAIDWYVDEWRAKPVGFVSYGGPSGGLRAVSHLREIFSALHAATVRDTVALMGPDDRFDGQGRPGDPDAVAAAEALLDQLTWWGRALREARERRPFPG
ncbi:NADPH-dependent FMN reductase [Streptomyces sp. NPDC058171]